MSKQLTKIAKNGNLLVVIFWVDKAEKHILVRDEKFSAHEIQISCDVLPQGTGEIIFTNIFYEAERDLFLNFFDVHTNLQILYDDKKKYYYFDLFDIINKQTTLLSGNIKDDSEYDTSGEEENVPIIPYDEQESDESDVAEEIIFCGINVDNPQIVSVAFSVQTWKEKKAREFLTKIGFAIHCNITDPKTKKKSKKGVRRNEQTYEWFQNDPINYNMSTSDLIYCEKQDPKYKGIYIKIATIKPLQGAKHGKGKKEKKNR